MNSAKYVDGYIKELKKSGLPKQKQVWNLAMACIGWPYIFGDRGQYCTPGQRKAVYNKHPDQTGLIDRCQVLKGSKPGCDGCKWFPGGERVRSFDCRGFTYWNLLQIYGWELMGTGATAQWNNPDNWKAKGRISDGIPKDTLVCLFYSKNNKEKTWEHTGFGLNNETVECSNGVQYFSTRNKKWTHWAVPACIDGEVDPVPVPDTKPTIKRGSKGPYVTLMQTALHNKGYDLGLRGIDGDFGRATEKALKQFQKDWGLVDDGICGPKTWEKLESSETPALMTVHIPHLTQAQADALLKEYSGAWSEAENA